MNGNTQVPTATTKLADVPDYKQTYIPKSTYWHRIKDAEFGMSKAANQPMFTLEVEVVDHPGIPDPKTPGSFIDPNGTTANMYLSLSEKGIPNLKRFFKGCGLPLDTDLATLVANPNPAFLIAQKFLAVGYSKPEAQVDEVTKQPIKNPVTGQDLIYYRYQVGEVFPKS